MGKIIKFDPNRRRSGRGGKDTRNWTRPEDYGASPQHRRGDRRRTSSPPPFPPSREPRTVLWARLAVVALVLAALAVSLLGLD